MERIAKFGYVWRHKKSKKIHGAKIDVETMEQLSEYEQVPRKTKDAETVTEDTTTDAGEPLFAPSNTRRGKNGQ